MASRPLDTGGAWRGPSEYTPPKLRDAPRVTTTTRRRACSRSLVMWDASKAGQRWGHYARRVRATVLIPSRDNAAGLKAALESLARQTMRPELSVIVIDNGSRDNSVPLARQLADRVLIESQPGSYRARNAGLAAAETDLVLTLDSDCRPVYDDWAARHLAALEAAPPDVFAMAAPLMPEPGGDWWSARADVTPRPAFDAGGQPAYAVGGNRSFRADVVRELGGFPPRGADDAALGLAARARGWRIGWLAEAPVYHTNPRGWRGYFRQMRKVGGYAGEAASGDPSVLRLAHEFVRAGVVGGKYFAKGNPREGQAAVLRITALALGARGVWRAS